VTDTASDGHRIGDVIAELDVLKRELLAALAQPISHAPSGGASPGGAADGFRCGSPPFWMRMAVAAVPANVVVAGA
jgi:hypothetical protein